jgi:hypothetical protein
MVQFKGSISGKNIFVYSPKGGKKYSSSDLGQYLKKFKLCNALKLIGELSNELLCSTTGKTLIIEGVPVSDGVLAYLSMRLIEVSNDYRSKDMNIDDLLKAIDMFFGISDPYEKDQENAQGCFIRFGASQFDYDCELRHLIPRTLIIYRDLWKGNCNINQAIQDIFNLNLQDILTLSILFLGASKYGFFHQFENNLSESIMDYLQPNKQEAFLKKLSFSYKDFRDNLNSDNLLTEEYEKFRFNPLHTYPLITPERNLNLGKSPIYIAPIPFLILERMTKGLYFTLSDHFNSGKGNQFRSDFGIVFQEYVYLLLQKSLGESNVKQEWKYKYEKNSRNTPDLFAIKDNIAVLIEVKQAGLYQKSKLFGEVEDIKNDILRNIGSGVNQMWEFENHLKNSSCSAPDWFKGIKIVERIVVTYDRSYFLNSFLREEIAKNFPHISNQYHWHIVAIEELEYFLGIVGENFIEELENKRLDDEGDGMDFRDYYTRKFPANSCINSYLLDEYDKFFESLNLPSEDICNDA